MFKNTICTNPSISNDKISYNHNNNFKFNPLDCLNCPGCLSNDEIILINQQNIDNAILNFNKLQRKIISISSASLISLANHFKLKPSEIFSYLTYSFNQKNIEFIFQEIQPFLTEFLKTIKSTSILISSICPAWISYVQVNYPNLFPYLSIVPSPMLFNGYKIKFNQTEKIFHLAVMSCADKKLEISNIKNINFKPIDLILTTFEFLNLLQKININISKSFINNLPLINLDLNFGFDASGIPIFEIFKKILLNLNLNFNPNNISIKKMPYLNDILIYQYFNLNFDIIIIKGLIKVKQFFDFFQNNRKLFNSVFIHVLACKGGCILGNGQIQSKLFLKSKINPTFLPQSSFNQLYQSFLDNGYDQFYTFSNFNGIPFPFDTLFFNSKKFISRKSEISW